MIYLSPPSMTEVERRLLLEAFDSNWVAPLGPFVDRLEQQVAEVGGRAHAVALSSGTAALHLALLLAGVRPGDEVLVPTLTFAATANAVSYCGATPVFVDAEPASWNVDPQLLDDELRVARRVGRRVGAVLPVDLYGQCADYEALLRVCADHGVPLVADAAEAVGASFDGRPAGSFGLFSAFSFNGNKIITTGGGGALLTDDADAAARARYLATQARLPAEHYEHAEIGFNYRLSNLLAAVGCGQIDRLPDILERRRVVHGNYRALFADVPGVSFAPVSAKGTPNHWLTVIVLDGAGSSDGTDGPDCADGREAAVVRVRAVIAALREQGCEARRVWKPMHLQPVFAGARAVGGAVAESAFAHGICLPSGTELTEAEQERIVATVCAALATGR